MGDNWTLSESGEKWNENMLTISMDSPMKNQQTNEKMEKNVFSTFENSINTTRIAEHLTG